MLLDRRVRHVERRLVALELIVEHLGELVKDMFPPDYQAALSRLGKEWTDEVNAAVKELQEELQAGEEE